jgi:hypothetical protein
MTCSSQQVPNPNIRFLLILLYNEENIAERFSMVHNVCRKALPRGKPHNMVKHNQPSAAKRLGLKYPQN